MNQPYAWYAVYTKSRTEKKLSDRLNEKGIEAYVPLRRTLKQWSDRKKFVTEPVISSYVFVKVSPGSYYEVLNTPGAVRYIWFGGKPAAIPERQIDSLKLLSSSGAEIECLPGNITPGTPVKVISGPLRGLEGEMLSHLGKNKVLVRIDHINQALLVSVPAGILSGTRHQAPGTRHEA
jgi:transcriptional antiterminator RfaH